MMQDIIGYDLYNFAVSMSVYFTRLISNVFSIKHETAPKKNVVAIMENITLSEKLKKYITEATCVPVREAER